MGGCFSSNSVIDVTNINDECRSYGTDLSSRLTIKLDITINKLNNIDNLNFLDYLNQKSLQNDIIDIYVFAVKDLLEQLELATIDKTCTYFYSMSIAFINKLKYTGVNNYANDIFILTKKYIAKYIGLFLNICTFYKGDETDIRVYIAYLNAEISNFVKNKEQLHLGSESSDKDLDERLKKLNNNLVSNINIINFNKILTNFETYLGDNHIKTTTQYDEMKELFSELKAEIDFADRLFFLKLPNVPKFTTVVAVGGNINKHKQDIKHLRKLLTNKKLTDKQKEQYLKKIESIKSKIQKQTGGNTNQYKEDIKHLRKLLKNKKLTDNQKQQYLKKIESIKVKIEKQNNKDKINKCKEHIINLQKTLKNKNITESQKQQCHHKISNYKLKIKELK
jgi:hypothetical protein